MRIENRLINDFRNQDKTTVWKFLDAMAANYAVYSTHLNGLSPFLTDYDVYLYCNDENVVILCLDCCGNSEEQTYDESESLSSIILNDNYEPRISVVWKLTKAVNLAKNHLQNVAPTVNVHGILLTEANILNEFELYPLWETNHVTVIDNFTRLKYRKIQVSSYANDDLPCKSYIRHIMDASIDASKDMEPMDMDNEPTTSSSEKEDCEDDYEDEFSKLLDYYLREGMEVVDENTPLDNSDSDQPEENDEITEEEFFPDGEIIQNDKMSVQVEILRPIMNPREELDKLVGCEEIKRRMDELVALTSYNKMMREIFPNSKQHEVSLHSVFLGRPGTGKTTVCKIYGSLLRQAGALSKGHVVVCDRGTFIGTLWGDEERSMRQVLEMAKGGVLMIDEAYLLNGSSSHDPGKLVIQLLMNVLADEKQRDIAVVLCGYKEPMMKLLVTNPGLQSRFPNKFEFVDFTVDELLEITKRRLKEYNYRFSIRAWEKYRDMLSQVYQMRDPETWGNARFVANQLEQIYIQHATRCVKHQPKEKGDLLVITPEDILPIEVPRQKKKIGF